MFTINQIGGDSGILAENRDLIYRLALSSLFITAILFIPADAFAAPNAADSPISMTLCIVVKWFTGPLGKAIATLGIVVLGIGAMMGKVSWQMALTVSLGISVMHGGSEIVGKLTGTGITNDWCNSAPAIDPTAIIDALCTLAGWAQGATGKALGTLAVITLGISALMGKVSAGLGIVLAVGIGTVFGASEIVGALGIGGAVPAECSP